MPQSKLLEKLNTLNSKGGEGAIREFSERLLNLKINGNIVNMVGKIPIKNVKVSIINTYNER